MLLLLGELGSSLSQEQLLRMKLEACARHGQAGGGHCCVLVLPVGQVWDLAHTDSIFPVTMTRW
jgi:hypothetical protein